MDWLIFHLVGNDLTHYQYDVQCKFFGYVKNKKQEGIVASAILRVRDIPYSNVLSCPSGEDIAYVASINHTPKVVWSFIFCHLSGHNVIAHLQNKGLHANMS